MQKVKNYLKTNKLISSSLFVMFISMSVNVINYFYHLVFGRLLGPVDYGILASLYSVLYIVSIVPQSTSFAIVKFISSARLEEERRNIYLEIKSFTTKMSLILALILLLFSYPISRFMNLDNFWYIAIISPILFLSILTLVNQATFQGMLNFKSLVIPNVISAISKFVFGIIFIFLGIKVMGAMMGVLIGAMFAFLYSFNQIKRFILGKTKGKFDIRKFLKYSFPILIQSLAFTSIFTTDLILVKHYLSPHDAGIYASLSMLGKIIFFAVSPIVSVLFPEISKRQANGISYRKVTLNSLFIAGFVCFGITTAYFVFPNLVVGSLYGKLFLEAGLNLPMMGIFMSLYTLSYMVTNFFLSINITWVSYVVLASSVFQVFGISVFHQNISQVIYVSVAIMLTSFVVLISSLIYNLSHE